MVSLQEFSSYCDHLLSISEFKDYGPNGLQIEGKQKIKCFATAVSASLETIEKAVEEKVDLLLVHHGIFWYKDNPVIKGSKKKKIFLLLKNEITLLAYHLPLDAHAKFGNNWKAAKDLGFQNLTPFGQLEGKMMGVKGTFPSISKQNFQKKLERYYDHPASSVLAGKKEMTSAAILSGGAHRKIQEAIDENLDAFITGSFDEPIFHLSKEEGINFFALGHANTETVGPKAIGEHLEKHFKIPHLFLNLPNPF